MAFLSAVECLTGEREKAEPQTILPGKVFAARAALRSTSMPRIQRMPGLSTAENPRAA